MGYAIATVTGSSGDEAHYKVLAAIKTLAEANGWTTLRYDTSGADKELILSSTGLSGTEQIFCGFRCYQNPSLDYYNIEAAAFTGYLSANTFAGQPGYKSSGVPCHNNAVTYYITANAQRIVGCFKVGTPVYCHFYVGKFLPYGRPGEYAYPMCAMGHFVGPEAIRYSSTSYSFPYYGYGNNSDRRYSHNNPTGFTRRPDGVWTTFSHWPWVNSCTETSPNGPIYSMRPAGNTYQPLPITLHSWSNQTYRGNVYGELDGVYAVSGFNNASENVMQIGGTFVDQTGMTVAQAVDAIITAGGRAMIVLQDSSRTEFFNYIALEMK